MTNREKERESEKGFPFIYKKYHEFILRNPKSFRE
jgi:hypothetical protein